MRLEFLVITAGCAVAAGALAQAFAAGVNSPLPALTFLAVVAAGEFCRFSLPGGREVAPVASAGALGYGLVLAGSRHPAGQAAAIAAAAVCLGAIAHVVAGRSLQWEAMARRVVQVTLVAVSYLLIPLPRGGLLAWPGLLVAVLLMALCGLFDLGLAAAVRAHRTGTGIRTAFSDEGRARGALTAATGATAVLLLIFMRTIGLPALVPFAASIVAVQVAFTRLARLHTGALQIARGLPRSLEVAGYLPVDHVHRVAALAVAVGRQLAMTERELLDLEYAALLHDIGHTALTRPLPGGAAIFSAPDDQLQIAARGAEMIARTGTLSRVADIVRCQYDPIPSRQSSAVDVIGGGPPASPLASRILKVVNAYDEMIGDDTNLDRHAAILCLLKLQPSPAYDQAVIDTLQRIVTTEH